jgi:hypothetical protein
MLYISIFSQKIVAIIYIVSDGGTIPNVTSSAQLSSAQLRALFKGEIRKLMEPELKCRIRSRYYY